MSIHTFDFGHAFTMMRMGFKVARLESQSFIYYIEGGELRLIDLIEDVDFKQDESPPLDVLLATDWFIVTTVPGLKGARNGGQTVLVAAFERALVKYGQPATR